MKRPEFIEVLEAAAKAGKRAETDYGQSFIRRCADEAMFERAWQPDSILELLRYVKVLERALANAMVDAIQQGAEMDNQNAYIEVASDELTELETVDKEIK